MVAGAFTFHNAIGNKSVTPNSAADGTPAAFIAAYDAGSDAASDAESVGAVPAAAGLAASAAAVPGAAAPSANAPHQQAALPPTSRRPAAHHDVAGVYATNATIRHGDHFAEIRVHRRSAAPRDSTFVWWTEGATAKPGVDYVAQEKVTKSFPRGKLSTSFYIKLVPNASRAESAKFYIAIADAGDGSSTGKIDRAAVWLPANHEASEPPG